MTPDFVVDVGNSRIKCGRCSTTAIVDSAPLPPDDPASWREQIESWHAARGSHWLVTGVNPRQCTKLCDWLAANGQQVQRLEAPNRLPLQVLLPRPDQVGIDRLLNAVAANSRRTASAPAVVVDAGSAVTVDWLDETGAFRGGAIFPGLRLMSQALNSYTALLPFVELSGPPPALPGDSTEMAIKAGVFWTVVGGINALVHRLASQASEVPAVFLTGGDAWLLDGSLDRKAQLWPAMTLEGIRLTAQSWNAGS
jgi:type III pantothenate kinase